MTAAGPMAYVLVTPRPCLDPEVPAFGHVGSDHRLKRQGERNACTVSWLFGGRVETRP